MKNSSTRSILYRQTGTPAEVLQLEEYPLEAPAPGAVVLEMKASSINPADINMIEGRYGKQPPLPAIPGNEGVGQVIEVGPEVDRLAVGDLCIVPDGVGAWSERCVVDAGRLYKLPAEVDVLQAAMLRVNPPTAWRMLHDFVELAPGDWIIQNAANSGVGLSVIQIAKALGLRTVNVVRREALIEELKEAGADVVILDDRASFKRVPELTGGAEIKLGLNAVGGSNALGVAANLAQGGVHVTYGAMSKEALKIPNSFLIFKDIRFRGFWISRWFEAASTEDASAMFDELVKLVEDGKLKVPVDTTYSIDDFRQAVTHAQQESRGGKVLFRFS